MKQSVLFICTHNSARSQMAEGLLNHFHGDCFRGYSAGTEATRVHPYAVRALADIGIDISGYRSKMVEEFQGETFDTVVTVCDNARESCPFFPGKRVIHRSFRDPSRTEGSDAEILQAFREVRDEIRAWIDDEEFI
ncbi:MAG: arsenate reductase ArsC [Spirochaetes bacterium]|nr:arsenate reductase ArsC [Spirochaetota bacterium]